MEWNGIDGRSLGSRVTIGRRMTHQQLIRAPPLPPHSLCLGGLGPLWPGAPRPPRSTGAQAAPCTQLWPQTAPDATGVAPQPPTRARPSESDLFLNARAHTTAIVECCARGVRGRCLGGRDRIGSSYHPWLIPSTPNTPTHAFHDRRRPGCRHKTCSSGACGTRSRPPPRSSVSAGRHTCRCDVCGSGQAERRRRRWRSGWQQQPQRRQQRGNGPDRARGGGPCAAVAGPAGRPPIRSR